MVQYLAVGCPLVGDGGRKKIYAPQKGLLMCLWPLIGED
jgi:glycerate kinase